MKNLINQYYFGILAALCAGIAGISFQLGREAGSALHTSTVVLSCNENILKELEIAPDMLINPASAPQATSGKYIGSKNGTKYYLPNCAGAKRIKPENHVWFSNANDAKLQGYSPGKC